MGSFDTDHEDEQLATQLAQKAKGQSVTPEKLTNSGGFTSQNYLTDNSPIYYINKGEQPHFFFNLGNGKFYRDGETPYETSGVNSIVITDRRVILFHGQKGHDCGEAIIYNRIENFSTSSGISRHKIFIETKAHEYTVFVPTKIHRSYSYNQVKEAVSYAENQILDKSDPKKRRRNH